MQCLQHPELFGDDERRVIRQHHAARTDPDRRGRRREVRDQDRRRRARDAGHVVMLGDPEALVAEALDGTGELDRTRRAPPPVSLPSPTGTRSRTESRGRVRAGSVIGSVQLHSIASRSVCSGPAL